MTAPLRVDSRDERRAAERRARRTAVLAARTAVAADVALLVGDAVPPRPDARYFRRRG